MLKVYDQYKNPIGYIYKYSDLTIESTLDSGDKELSFTSTDLKADIQNEYYIETEDDLYVVKEVDISSDGFPKFVCSLDLEGLEAFMVESFSAVDCTLEEAASLAIAGTGWRVRVEDDIDKIRSSAATTRCTPLDLLSKVKDAWMCEIKYDTKNEIVYFAEKFGEDKGVFFTKSLNLKKVELTGDSYDYVTRIVPIGENDLRIDDINDGVGYVENYQYSDKVKTLIWEDTSYTDAEALKEDAEAKLDDLSKPEKSYEADVVDLAKQNAKYEIMDFGLGDTILLMDETTGIKDKQRIVKLKEYPDDPYKNSCELSNTTLTWEEMQKKIKAATDAFEDITNSDGTVNGYYVHGITSDGVVVIETVIGPDGSTTTTTTSLTNTISAINGELDATTARIGELEVTSLTVAEADIRYATIENLEATQIIVETIYGEYADFSSLVADEIAALYEWVGTLEANQITVEYLDAHYANIEYLEANYATITDLEAASAIITILDTDIANIKSLLAGEAGVGELEAIHLTVKNAIIDSALIAEALIGTVLADIIESNIIYTDQITIRSVDGGIVLAGTTMQFSDADGNVRLQLGEDADGNFTFVLYDESGTGIMIDSEGIHASAIPDGLIVNDMVANDAAISGYKLDIDSVTSYLNEYGGLVVDAAQVTINNTTLSAAFTTIEEKTDEALAAAEAAEKMLEDLDLDAVTDITAYYCVGSSPDYPPYEPGASGWTTDQPTAGAGEYLWIVFKVDYVDGSTEWKGLTCLTDDVIRSEVSTLQTEFAVVQGQIEAKIWESDIKESIEALNEVWTEEIEGIYEQYAALDIELGNIDARVGELNTEITTIEQNALADAVPYYAVSESSSDYPELGSDEWTTDQPEAEEGKYVWISYQYTNLAGEISWTDPMLLTDDYTRQTITQFSDRYAEIQIELDAITEEIYSMWEEVSENYVTTTVLETTIESAVSETEASIMQTVSGTYSTITDLTEAVSDLSTSITQAVDASESKIMLEVSGSYATKDMLDDYVTGAMMDASIEAYVNESLATIKISVDGGLGDEAWITVSTDNYGYMTSIDLRNVRQSFANDTTTSYVEIGAGTVAFVSNTLLINSDNCILEADGTLSVYNGIFYGTVATTNGSETTMLTGGGLELYYNNVEYGKLYAASWETSSNSLGIHFGVENTASFVAFGYGEDESDVASFIINYGLNPGGLTEGIIFYDTVRFRGLTYFSMPVQMDSGLYVDGQIYADSDIHAGASIYCTLDAAFDNGYGIMGYNSSGLKLIWLAATSGDWVLIGDEDYPISIAGSTEIDLVPGSSKAVWQYAPGEKMWWRVPYLLSFRETITPSAASTPTSVVITFGTTFPSTPRCSATAISTAIGTRVLGTAVSDVSATGCTVWVTRTNTTQTGVDVIATSGNS